MNTHAKKRKKTTNKHKKSKNKATHEHQKKIILNLIPIHWSNPLSGPYRALIQTLPKSFLTVVQWDVSKPRKKKSKTQSKPKLEKAKEKTTKMNTHAKKEKKQQQISTKKAKQRQNISTKKNLLNLIPIHWSNPLSTPYQALLKPLFRPYRNLF